MKTLALAVLALAAALSAAVPSRAEGLDEKTLQSAVADVRHQAALMAILKTQAYHYEEDRRGASFLGRRLCLADADCSTHVLVKVVFRDPFRLDPGDVIAYRPLDEHGFGLEMLLVTPANRYPVRRAFVADADVLAALAACEAEGKSILRRVGGTAIAPPL